jgi:hypothetical protein
VAIITVDQRSLAISEAEVDALPRGIVRVDKAGNVLYYNEATRALVATGVNFFAAAPVEAFGPSRGPSIESRRRPGPELNRFHSCSASLGATDRPRSPWYADPKTVSTSSSPTSRSTHARLDRAPVFRATPRRNRRSCAGGARNQIAATTAAAYVARGRGVTAATLLIGASDAEPGTLAVPRTPIEAKVPPCTGLICRSARRLAGDDKVSRIQKP